MKVLLLNGSPRLKGNTSYAIKKIAQGISENSSHTVEVIDICKLTVSGCTACDICKSNGGDCISKDDSKHIIDKISDADMVIFGTPVYWWGVSAQLKAVIDKFYSAEARFCTQKKKIVVVSIGANAITDKQYSLISDQFSCICDFLSWEKIFNVSFAASNPADLEKSEESSTQLVEMWKEL